MPRKIAGDHLVGVRTDETELGGAFRVNYCSGGTYELELKGEAC